MREFRTISVTDEDLDEVNNMLDWHAGTLLPDGRLLGRLERTPGKRTRPDTVPDERIILLNRRVPLRGRSVLEIGCFEGIHTLGLCQFSDDVTAVDVRPSNVIKTMARLSWHGTHAKVFLADAEEIDETFGDFDVVFHIGVLYHLMHPVAHLEALAKMTGHLFLDTHVAALDGDILEVETDGLVVRGSYRREGGWSDPFSGKDERSLHLTLDSLEAVLDQAGFIYRNLIEQRDERHGPRVLIHASKVEGPS